MAVYWGVMPSLRRTRWLCLLLVSLTLALVVACGGGDDEQPAPSATPGSDGERTPEASSTPGAELGEEPIFWRTLDGFRSVRAGEGYKIVLRITNGYDEETLPVVARTETGTGIIDFDAGRVEPGEGEAPGTFYTFNLELPRPGRWQVTVTAGLDEATMTVDVAGGDSSAG